MLIDYNFEDTQPNEGANYYRLLQMDSNGAYEYYGPIYQDYHFDISKQDLKLYPNPNSQGTVNISIGTQMTKTNLIEIYDYAGRKLRSIQIEEATNTL